MLVGKTGIVRLNHRMCMLNFPTQEVPILRMQAGRLRVPTIKFDQEGVEVL
jgi:hypothetical protein